MKKNSLSAKRSDGNERAPAIFLRSHKILFVDIFFPYFSGVQAILECMEHPVKKRAPNKLFHGIAIRSFFWYRLYTI
jgi:hypothetical protein